MTKKLNALETALKGKKILTRPKAEIAQPAKHGYCRQGPQPGS